MHYHGDSHPVAATMVNDGVVVAFFASKDVPAGEELTFDYGYGASAKRGGYCVPSWFDKKETNPSNETASNK